MPYNWTIVLLKLIYVIKVVQHLFFPSRLAYHLLNLAEKHGITLIPAFIRTNLNVEGDYLSWGRLVRERHILPHTVQAVF